MIERRAARPVAAPVFARYRLPVALSLAVLGLLGIFAFGRLPVDFLPSLEAPRLRVQVSVPGLTPEAIEDKVMRPLEAALLDTPGVVSVESVATPGSAAANLYLRHYRDADAVQQEVTARLERLKTMLPAAVAPPAVSRLDAAHTAAEVSVTARDRDPLALRDWVDGELVKRLRELPGVATVEAQGGVTHEIVVMPDQRRLAGFGIGFDDVMQALQTRRAPEASIAAPPVKRRRGREMMQSGNVAAVAAMPVMLPSGESIPLAEVADVTLGEEAGAGRVSPNGAEAVTLTVQKQARAARADVAERVRAEIDWMRANRLIPDGIEVRFPTHQLDQARRVEKRLVAALVGGALSALLVAYLISGSGVMQHARQIYGRLLGVLWRRPWPLPVLALVLVGALALVFSIRPPQTLPAFNPAPGATMTWRLRGPDAARLAALGDELVQRLRALPSLRDVRNSARLTQEQFVLHLDAARAAELGLDITDVGRALAIALTGVSAGSIRDAEHRYDIRLQLPPKESVDAVARGRILLLGELKDRPAVYLRDVATVERRTVPAEIRRENGLPLIQVTAVPAVNVVPRQIVAVTRQALRGYVLPPGYELSGDGVGNAAVRDARETRLPALALSFVFAALLLWQRSWRVAILVTVCAAIVSAAVTALLVNLPLPFSVWFGAVIAIGIAAFYAAVFVTPIETLRRVGTLSRRSLAQTAKDLLLPLLTMTLTALAGMAPLMLLGDTVVVLRPVIIIVTASLVVAFLATVLLIPPLYILLTRTEQSPAQPHL